MAQGKVIFEAGQKLTHSYFPITAVISTEFRSTEKLWIELEAIRNDGLFITFYAAKLHREGIVNVMRGNITVIKRDALEKTTCECC